VAAIDASVATRLIIDALPDLIMRMDATGKIWITMPNPTIRFTIRRRLSPGKLLSESGPRKFAGQIMGWKHG